MNEFYFMVKNDINLLTLYSERITIFEPSFEKKKHK